jgi:hypothetical protein
VTLLHSVGNLFRTPDAVYGLHVLFCGVCVVQMGEMDELFGGLVRNNFTFTFCLCLYMSAIKRASVRIPGYATPLRLSSFWDR